MFDDFGFDDDPLDSFDVFAPARPAPDWLITDDYSDTDLGVLKTGKEADVSLVERRSRGSDGRAVLLARKRYRPPTATQGELRERGFTRASSFRNTIAYREGRRYGKSHTHKAAMKMTALGRAVVAHEWRSHEFATLRRAWDAGVDVPYPVENLDDGFVMQFIGDDGEAAPRLVQARLTPTEAAAAFELLVGAVNLLATAGIVHADLSAYNVLWWNARPWLIDFPQAIDVASARGITFLQRDVTNLCQWYRRYGGVADANDIVNEALSGASRR